MACLRDAVELWPGCRRCLARGYNHMSEVFRRHREGNQCDYSVAFNLQLGGSNL